MEKERRNDVGAKVLASVVAVLVTIIMGFSINLAVKVDNKSNVNSIDIRGLRVNQDNIKENIKEIKEGISIIRQAVTR